MSEIEEARRINPKDSQSYVPSLVFGTKLLKGVTNSLNLFPFFKPYLDFENFSSSHNPSIFHHSTFPNSSIISNFTMDFPKTHFDLMLPFRYPLNQSVNHYFCEVGLVQNSFKIKRPSSRILRNYTLHGVQDFNEILFDHYCRYIFDPKDNKAFNAISHKEPL